PDATIHKAVDGYMVNAGFAAEQIAHITPLQNTLHEAFPHVVWKTPPSSLHITLLDWIAPMVDYGVDKKELYAKIFPEFDHAMAEVLKNHSPIKVTFSQLHVAQNCAIIVGEDDGTFQSIRTAFLNA